MQIVRQFFAAHFGAIHGARQREYLDAIASLMSGSALTLTTLARGVMAPSQRAAIKRMDRLIGSARIDVEAHIIATVLIRLLARWMDPLVIAVDWSAANPGGTMVELRASLVWLGMGRGVTVYQEVHPLRQLSNTRIEAQFLHTLRDLIPPPISVVVLTDAGFRRPWFVAAERLNFQWIGRIRRGVHIAHDGVSHDIQAWFACATAKAQRYHDCSLSAAQLLCDTVVYRAPVRARKHYRMPGSGSTGKTRKEASVRGREPWLLAHSSALRNQRADEIVALYARRMQIEENFRDSKSARLGLGQEMSRSRSCNRLHALLLISSLAHFFLWHIGQMAEAEGLHKRHQATTRTSRELSVIQLARILVKLLKIPISRQGVQALRRKLQC